MNTLESFFQWLLAASLRASLLAGTVVCLQLALRHWLPARWRFALWLPVVLVLVAPVLPESRFSVQNRFADQVTPVIVKMEPLPSTGMSISESLPVISPIAFESRWTTRRRMLAVWLFGTATVMLVVLLGYRRSMRCILRDAVGMDAALAKTISSVAAELQLRRVPQVVVSKSVRSPAVAGLLRPMLLLPPDFTAEFSHAESRLILMHELTHLKRRDLPMNWLMCVLQALHWFNPLLWLAFARMRNDREAACDAQVLAANTADCRADYGHALLKLQKAPRHAGLSLAFVGIFQRNAALRSRIQSIATHRRPHPAWGVAAIVMVAALTMTGATRAETKPRMEIADGVGKTQVMIESKFIEVPEKEALVISAQAVEMRRDGQVVFVQKAQDFEALMDVLIQARRADVLSAPRIITNDTQQATIQIGREIPVPDKAAGKPGVEPVGVALTVVPTVGKEGISLAIKSIQTRLIDSETKKEIKGTPTPGEKVEISEVKIETTLTLKEGETAVLMRTPAKDAPSVITTVNARVMPAPARPADGAGIPADARKPKADSATIRDEKPLPAAEKEAKKDFVLPVLDLKDSSVRQAADVIMEYSKAVDPDKKGVKIVVFPNVDAGTKITLSLKDIPVTEALKFIASLSNTKLMNHRGGIYLGNPEIAKPVAGKLGFVFSPYKPDGEIDVRGLPKTRKPSALILGFRF